VNWGAEARYLKRYNINDNRSAFLLEPNTTNHKTPDCKGQELGSDANNLANNEFPFMPINRIIYSLNFAVLERIFSKFPPTFYHHLVFDLRKYAPKQKDLTAK
jgi:Fe(3+) dicitrate transport protein